MKTGSGNLAWSVFKYRNPHLQKMEDAGFVFSGEYPEGPMSMSFPVGGYSDALKIR